MNCSFTYKLSVRERILQLHMDNGDCIENCPSIA